MTIPNLLRRTSRLLGLVLVVVGCGSDGGSNQDATAACTPDAGVTCACPPGARCSNDEVCFGKHCDDVSEWNVRIARQSARSCDVLLELQTGSRFIAATWSEGVMGHVEARGPLVGLALISKADADLAEVPVRVSGTGAPPAVRHADCADRLGRSLASSTVSVEP